MASFPIRRKIFLGFLVIILLSTAFLLISYSSFKIIKNYSAKVMPISHEMVELQTQLESTGTLSKKVESYLLVSSEEKKNQVLDLIQKIDRDMQKISVSDPTDFRQLGTVREKLNVLKEKIRFLARESGAVTSYQHNKTILTIYRAIDEIERIQKELLSRRTSQMQLTVVFQNTEMNALMARFYFVEALIIALGLLFSLILSRVIVSRLSRLQKSTRYISAGDLPVTSAIASISSRSRYPLSSWVFCSRGITFPF